MSATCSKARTDGVRDAVMETTVDVGDGLLHVAVAGTGVDMVMLHGWTLDHRNWLPQLPLAETMRLVMPDRRGCGRSTAPSDLANEWHDVDRLARRERFVLVGLSQGASVALDYARHRPERLLALVLVGAPLNDVVPHEPCDELLPRARYAEMAHAGQLTAMKRAWSNHALVRRTASAAPLVDAMLADYDGRDLLAPPSQIAVSHAEIAALPMPVLAVAGTRDTAWRRRVCDFIGTTAPKGRVVSIADAGHLCNLDNPAQFNAVLANLVATLRH